jgi:PadR family transcriptional regulator, regulatory protein PadR
MCVCYIANMSQPLRMSRQRLRVLAKLSDPPGVEMSGADIMRVTSLASGTLYPILYALEDGLLVESRWEEGDPRTLGRPRRRFYKLTSIGERTARAEAEELEPLTRASNARTTVLPVADPVEEPSAT